MQIRKAVFGILIGFILLAALVVFNKSLRVNRSIPKMVSEEAKTLPASVKLRDVISKETITFDKFSNKSLLINFWASWCDACIEEMPSLVKLYQNLKGEGLEVVSINLDADPERVVPRIIEKLSLNFRVFIDISAELPKLFDIIAIPYTIVTDRNHKVIWSESGDRDWTSEQVMTEIRKILNKSP